MQRFVHNPRANIIVIATNHHGMWVMDANPINKKDKIQRGRF